MKCQFFINWYIKGAVAYQYGSEVYFQWWSPNKRDGFDRGQTCDLVLQPLQENWQTRGELGVQRITQITDDLTPKINRNIISIEIPVP